MKTTYRLLFLLLCIVLLGIGIVVERHKVHSLGDGQAMQISGPAFVAGAAVDGFLLKDAQLFDAYSLTQTTAGLKDCKT